MDESTLGLVCLLVVIIAVIGYFWGNGSNGEDDWKDDVK